MTLSTKYQIDPDVVELARLQLVTALFHPGSESWTEDEVSLMSEIGWKLMETRDLENDDTFQRYGELLETLLHGAYDKYKSASIGSWSMGAIRATVGVGKAMIRDTDNDHRMVGLSRLAAQILTFQRVKIDGGSLTSFIRSLIRYFVHFDLGIYISRFLITEKEEHECAISRAQDAPTINDWLMRLGDAAPLTDSQLTVYGSLLALVKHGDIAEASLSHIPQLDVSTCEAEDNRLEELSAHTISHGVGQFHNRPDACLSYISQIQRRAMEDGARSAKRHTRFDFARFMIPRFLMDDALEAVDRQC